MICHATVGDQSVHDLVRDNSVPEAKAATPDSGDQSSADHSFETVDSIIRSLVGREDAVLPGKRDLSASSDRHRAIEFLF